MRWLSPAPDKDERQGGDAANDGERVLEVDKGTDGLQQRNKQKKKKKKGSQDEKKTPPQRPHPCDKGVLGCAREAREVLPPAGHAAASTAGR